MEADEKKAASSGSRHGGTHFGEEPGEDLSRILALSDGVFAFALTLLVLTLTVPVLNAHGLNPQQTSGALGAALNREYGQFLAYVFAFVMIAIWWSAHHRTFRYIERYDSVLTNLNLMLLLEIAVMPFILEVYSAYQSTQVAVILFSAIQAATGLTLNAIWTYATSHHRLVSPKLPEATIHYTTTRGRLTPVIFLAAIGVSFVNVSVAEYTWILAIVAQRFLIRYG
ncbi:MAG: TMEM175 family protein [Thermoplasmata archaeon]